MGSRLVLRLFCLLLALCAGAGTVAPPCFDAVLPSDCEVGVLPLEDACEGPCEDEDDCSGPCDGCACCPLRVPATVTVHSARCPTLTLFLVEREAPPPPATRPLEDVFRPPRRSA